MVPDRSLEQVEEIDPDGSVRRLVPRWKMREDNLLHRSAYVAVLTQQGSEECLIVHRRAMAKDINPGLWAVAFGGVCGANESVKDTASRELEEEAGIGGTHLTLLGSGLYQDHESRILGTIYVTRYDGGLAFVDGEVIESERVPIRQIDEWVAATPVCPDSVFLVLPQVAAFLRNEQMTRSE